MPELTVPSGYSLWCGGALVLLFYGYEDLLAVLDVKIASQDLIDAIVVRHELAQAK